MNRYTKEQKKRYEEARKGLSKEEVIALNLKEELMEKIKTRAKQIHIERFPEEYDMMYDSRVDAKERASGNNPMSQEYIDRIKKKRKDLGVPPLSENGTASSNKTYQMCVEEAKKEIYSDLELR